MKYYMVFGSQKRPVFGGGTYLDWSPPPIGVYSGENADEACKAAASDHGSFGTFFAIEGHVWGLELLRSAAKQIGQKGGANERLAEHLDRMEERAEAREAQIERLLIQSRERDD